MLCDADVKQKASLGAGRADGTAGCLLGGGKGDRTHAYGWYVGAVVKQLAGNSTCLLRC